MFQTPKQPKTIPSPTHAKCLFSESDSYKRRADSLPHLLCTTSVLVLKSPVQGSAVSTSLTRSSSSHNRRESCRSPSTACSSLLQATLPTRGEIQPISSPCVQWCVFRTQNISRASGGKPLSTVITTESVSVRASTRTGHSVRYDLSCYA